MKYKVKGSSKGVMWTSPRVWLILAAFLVVVAVVAVGAIGIVRGNSAEDQTLNYATQSLSHNSLTALNIHNLQPEDQLIGGTLSVLGSVETGQLMAPMAKTLALQGSDMTLTVASTTGTTTIRFAPPTGNSTIMMPHASGTVAVSASGPLLLSANGNLSCPSCGVAKTNTTTQVTNNYSTTQLVTNNYTTVNTLALTAGEGIAITDENGSYTIASTVDGADRSLSNLSGVAINTNLTPGTGNSVDLGSQANTFRNGYFGTAVQTPSIDSEAGGSLSIGAINASSIQLGADTTIASGKMLTTNGAVLFRNATDSNSAFQVQDSAGVALLNANTTQGTLSVGTYVPTTVWTQSPTTTTNYATTNSNLYSVATADFNGDGKPDMAVANNTSNTVSVLINNGNGTFAAKVDYVTGSGAFSVAAADFNGDGKPDMAVVNSNSSTISIFMNTGNGTFAPRVDYATGTSPVSLVAADFNGDGKLDLAVTAVSSNTVSVLMNNGNGTFAPKVDYATGSAPRSVATADFNGDGKLDMVVANTTSNTVSIFMNTGNGTFAPRVDYATDSPWSVATADFNGDGKPDMAVANYNSRTISLFMNNSNGNLTLGSSYTISCLPRQLTTTDFNGDMQPDIASVGNLGSGVSVILMGGITGTPVAQSPSKLIINAGATNVGQLIQGTAGQTADLLQIRNDINATLLSVSATGNTTIAGTLSVAGAVTATGTLTVASTLTASSGLTVIGTLTSTGSAVFKKSSNSTTAFQIQNSSGANLFTADTANAQVVVTKLVVNTAVTVNGHIITGGTTPMIAAAAAACTAPTVSIVGNDTSGTVTIIAGTGCAATGSLSTVTFNTPFGTAPRIIMTAGNASATDLKLYSGSATTTTFTVDTATVPTDGTTYTFNYWAVQ